MPLTELVRSGLSRMIKDAGAGMKCLLMDGETMGAVSVSFSHSEMIQKEIFLFELLGRRAAEKIPYMTCICFVRNTEQNIDHLCEELTSPRFKRYLIYFSQAVERGDIRRIAEADHKQCVHSLDIFYMDFTPIGDNLFTVGEPTCGKGQYAWNEAALLRCCSGIMSVLLSMQKCPNIRYQQSSEMCRLLAESLLNGIAKESDKLSFDIADSATLLIVDRREDAVTPILNQWTYEAMLHEIYGLERNRLITTAASWDQSALDKSGLGEEIVLSPRDDEFYRNNRYKNYGEIALKISQLLENYQEKHERHLTIKTIADMKKFIESYPEFKKFSKTVAKHIIIISELSKHVSTCKLMDLSELEQVMACQGAGSHSEIVHKILELINDEHVQDIDAIRLVALYALRYEQSPNNAVKLLSHRIQKKRKIEQKWWKFLQCLCEYGGARFRQADLFNSELSISRMYKTLAGERNVYCQHRPLLVDVVEQALSDEPLGLITMQRLSSSREVGSRRRNAVTVSILFGVNLLNYMDRYTLPGVLDQVQDYFNISNSQAGLLSTVFVCTYMLLAPVFGYLGDRYNRRLLMAAGVALWSLTTLAGSFVNSSHFGLFVLFRGLVGVGEASYSCITPSVIGDLYDGPARSRVLAVYYLAMPLGSGLGYIVGSNVAQAMSNWKWALRITPPFGLLAVLLLTFAVTEPSRGLAEGALVCRKSTYAQDVKFLLKSMTYMLTTASFTAVAFVIGAVTWWSPKFMTMAYKFKERDPRSVSICFGIITCLGGLFGVVIGSSLSARLKARTLRGDPLICGFSVLTSVPFLFLAIFLADRMLNLAWVFTFIATTCLCVTWPLIADIILFVVVPAKRATAEALQILVSHLVGDAGSPYFIGIITDAILGRRGNSTDSNELRAMQKSLYITPFVVILGGLGFLVTSFYIAGDRHRAEMLMRGNADHDKSEDFTDKTSDPMVDAEE